MKLDPKDGKKFYLVCATQIPAGKVPEEIQVIPFGRWKGYKRGDGETIEFEVTRELAMQALKYHDEFDRRYPNRDLVIDYEHQTLMGVEAPAAGWFKKLFLKSDGIYARPKEWTERAKEYFLKREYRYHSPVLAFNDVDGETGERIPLWVNSIGLTNSPFVNGIKPVVAKNEDEPRTIIYLTNPTTQLTQGDSAMEDLLQSLRYFLSLPLTSTADEIAGELNKLIARIKEGMSSTAAVTAKMLMDAFLEAKNNYKVALTSLGLAETASVDEVKAFALKHTTMLQELGLKPSDTVDHIKQTIVAAKGTQQLDLKLYVLKSEFDTLQLQLKTRDVDDAIKAAVQKGKIAPASLDNYKEIALSDLKKFNDLMTKIPDYSAVPLQEIDAKSVAKPADAAPDANTIEVAAKAGVSVEDIKKYGK